jgi:hypothetical protein
MSKEVGPGHSCTINIGAPKLRLGGPEFTMWSGKTAAGTLPGLRPIPLHPCLNPVFSFPGRGGIVVAEGLPGQLFQGSNGRHTDDRVVGPQRFDELWDLRTVVLSRGLSNRSQAGRRFG